MSINHELFDAYNALSRAASLREQGAFDECDCEANGEECTCEA